MTKKVELVLSRVLSGELGRQAALIEKETDEIVKQYRQEIIEEVKDFMQENNIDVNDISRYNKYFAEKMK